MLKWLYLLIFLLLRCILSHKQTEFFAMVDNFKKSYLTSKDDSPKVKYLGTFIQFAEEFNNRTIGQIRWDKLKNKTSQNQFKRDVLIFYKTFYPENGLFGENSPLSKQSQRVMALKKTLLFFSINGLRWNSTENIVLKNCTSDLYGSDWEFPMASSFTHGGRSMMIFEETPFDEFLNYIYRDVFNKTWLYYDRLAASHRITFYQGQIIEEKVRILGLIGGFQHLHKGMNIPFGGFGNLWAKREDKDNKTFIIANHGFGAELKNDSYWVIDNSHQHGHVYLRLDTNLGPNKISAILIGFEEEAPGARGMYSEDSHGIWSAFRSSINDTTLSGGTKWSTIPDLTLEQQNANYGGRCVTIKSKDIETVKLYIAKIESQIEIVKKFTWWALLSSNNLQSRDFFANILTSDDYEKIICQILNSKSEVDLCLSKDKKMKLS